MTFLNWSQSICTLHSITFMQLALKPLKPEFSLTKAWIAGYNCYWSWWSGVEASASASITKGNLRRDRLVLRWATMSGFNSRCQTFISVYNQPVTQGQLSLPSLWVSKWVPHAAEKPKAGMVHSVSGWMWGVQVKLRSLENTRHTWDVFMTRCYTNPRLPYLTC